MLLHIPPTGHLLSAKTRLVDVQASLDGLIQHDANHVDLQQQADHLANELRLAADSVQRALTAAEAAAALRRAA